MENAKIFHLQSLFNILLSLKIIFFSLWFRNELLTWFVKLQLAEYQQLFNETFEVSLNAGAELCFIKQPRFKTIDWSLQ